MKMSGRLVGYVSLTQFNFSEIGDLTELLCEFRAEYTVDAP